MDDIKKNLDRALGKAKDLAFMKAANWIIVGGGSPKSGPERIELNGLPGTGKTSIVREWAQEHDGEINFVEYSAPKLSVQRIDGSPVLFSTDEIDRMDRFDTVLFIDDYQYLKEDVEEQLNRLYVDCAVADPTVPGGERILKGLILVIAAKTV